MNSTNQKQKMTFWASIKQLVISRILIITVFFASMVLMFVLEGILYLTIRPWNRRLYRKIDNYLYSNMPYTFLPFSLQWWSETTFELIMDPSVASNKFGKEHAIILPNHRFNIDWLLLFPYASHFDIMGNLRICTKKSVQYIPLLGWIWKLHEHPFLERNLEKDKTVISGTIKDLIFNSDPGMIAFFPEGTRYTKEKHEGSMIIAKQKGFQNLKHHLLPRTRGFLELMKVLKSDNTSQVPAVGVYDALITVESATGDEKTPISVMSIMSGKPSRVKLLLRRYSIQDIPENEVECGNWLRERFQEKDKLLDKFFKTGDFFDGDESEEFKDFQLIKIPRQKKILVNFLVFFVAVVGLMVGYAGISFLAMGFSGKTLVFPTILIIGYLGLSGLESVQKIENNSSYGLKVQ